MLGESILGSMKPLVLALAMPANRAECHSQVRKSARAAVMPARLEHEK